jgi:hypothetical protein
MNVLFDPRRLARLQELERMEPEHAYPLAEYLGDLQTRVWGATTRNGAGPDANLRALHRVYLERLEALLAPPPAPTQQQGPPDEPPSPLLAQPNNRRSDVVALVKAQLRDIRDDARRAATAATGTVQRAHWQDIADRASDILDPPRTGASR